MALLATIGALIAKYGAAAAAVAGTTYSVVEGRRQGKIAEKENKRAADIEQRKAAQQNARARRKAIADQNIAIAQREAASAASGADSSGTAGAIGALQTQTGEATAFQRGQATQSIGQIDAMNAANTARSRGAQAQAIGGLTQQLGMGLGDVLANPGARTVNQQFLDTYNPNNSYIGRNPNTFLNSGYPVA